MKLNIENEKPLGLMTKAEIKEFLLNTIKEAQQDSPQELEPTLGDYLTEKQAQKLLGRKTSWFWEMRKRGKLKFSKVGNKIFYSKADLIKFIDSHKAK